MAKTVVALPLPTQHLGTTRTITVHRYGDPAARPKAYIQAGLHADEIPGMLSAHHLIAQLDEADRQGAIRGEDHRRPGRQSDRARPVLRRPPVWAKLA